MSLKKNRLIGMLIMSSVILALMLLIPYTLSLFKGGIEDETIKSQLYFYSNLGIGFLVGVMVIWTVEYFIFKGDANYGSGVGYFGIGEFPSIKFFKRFTAVQLTFLSFIFFNIVFFFAYLLKFGSGTGLTFLPQQFNALDSILFSSFLIPFPENLLAGFVIAICFLGLRIWARKTKMKKETFRTLAYTVAIIVGLFGIAWHSTVYPDSEISKLIVGFFWTVGAFLVILTGFFMVFAMMHLNNNLILDLARYYSSDVIIGIIIGIQIFMIAMYMLIYKGRLLGKKNE